MQIPGSVSTSIAILYVDDEPALLEIGKLFLEQYQHYSVTTCESATVALSLISEEPFDAIISDYQMPGMDGLQFLKSLRENGDDTPFIIFTGKGREEVAIEALNRGADFYLQKGGDPKSQFAVLANKIQYAVSRHRNETALRESEERYRNVVEDMTEFICRFLSGGEIIFVNDAYCRHFGMSKNDLIGSRFKPSIHPGDRGRIYSLFAGLNPDRTSFISEQRVIMPDGRIVWQRWSTRAIFDAHGLLTEYQSVGRDITDLMERDIQLQSMNDELLAANQQQRAIEEELRHQYAQLHSVQQALLGSEQRLAEIIDFLPDPTFAIDTNGKVTIWNKEMETLTGFSREEILNQGAYAYAIPFYGHPRPILVDMALHPDEEFLKKHYDRIEREGDIITGEVTYQHPSGNEITLWGKARVLHNEDGTIYGAIQSTRDMTRIKKTQTNLEEQHLKLQTAYEQLSRAEDKLRHQFDELQAAQEHITLSEARYRTIFEYTTAPTIIINEDTSIALANSAFEELSGYPLNQLIGMSWTDFVSQNDRKRMVEFHNQRRHAGKAPPRDYEFTFINREGNAYTTHVTVGLIPGTRDSVASLHDISELARMKENIRKSEEQLRMITDNMSETITMLDLSLNCMYVSPSLQELRGFSAEEGLKQSLEDVLTPQSLSVALHRLEEELQKEAEGSADPNRVVNLDLEVIRKDGSTIWVNNTIRFLYNADGAPESILILTRNIHEQKIAQDALRESELFNRKLIENLPDYILMYGQDETILHINHAAAQALGYSIDEMIGSNIFRYIAPEFHDMVREKVVLRKEGIDLSPYEIEVVSRSGTRFTVLIKGATIRHHDSDAILLVLTDITLRKSAEKALHNANRKLQLLSGVTRHDILNKLTTLQGYLTLAFDQENESDRIRCLKGVEAAAHDIEKHIEFAKQTEQLGKADLNWQAISDILPEVPEDTIILQDDCHGLRVLADPILPKVFANLLDNTLRHGEGATMARIFFEGEGPDCRIVWEDDGIGIPDDQKEAIFSRGIGKNTGFGLFISREILQISGITITETGVFQKGSRFEMHIPQGMWQYTP